MGKSLVMVRFDIVLVVSAITVVVLPYPVSGRPRRRYPIAGVDLWSNSASCRDHLRMAGTVFVSAGTHANFDEGGGPS
ncbi:hypothetical protein MWU77_00760 [Rhodococcus sp. F64268]|uniref:hypothetical protein n=1 Tax=Rhodococcus sp. F64268 TaxID=2926402 RepID=UPI001FF195B8|nr:hypothetical protein [Rhodococcus sp. F64268]MCK0089310.1 hypothetical protein [Rhodococcus sp. F64268]